MTAHNLDVKVRCTDEDRRKVEALAKHFDRNVSDTVRQLIRTAYTTMTHIAGFKPEVPSAPPVALTNIEDLFNALCTYQRDARLAGINKAEHAKARETFKQAIGPLADQIDWTDRS